MHSENATHTSVSSFSQGYESLCQLSLRQWRELVEEGEDEHRSEIRHHNGEKEQDECNPQPPCLWLGSQQEIDEFDNEGFKNQAEHKPLEEIG